MKETKNELLQFVGGIVMLAVGLFIFSQKVIVHSSWFGYGGFSVAGSIILYVINHKKASA